MIYLVRHGQTEFNLARRYQGALDSPLTPQGVEQAVRMGRLLRDLLGGEPCAIVSSPLGRALQTAEIIRREAGLAEKVEVAPALAEISLGSWDGLTVEEVNRLRPTSQERWRWHFHSPDGETYEALRARLACWLEEARARPGPLIAVSHGVSGRVLRSLYADAPMAEVSAETVSQDTVFRLCDGQVHRFETEAQMD